MFLKLALGIPALPLFLFLGLALDFQVVPVQRGSPPTYGPLILFIALAVFAWYGVLILLGRALRSEQSTCPDCRMPIR
jgi:hypothetical protein